MDEEEEKESMVGVDSEPEEAGNHHLKEFSYCASSSFSSTSPSCNGFFDDVCCVGECGAFTPSVAC